MLQGYYDYHVSTISGTGWFLPAMFFTEVCFVFIANLIGTKKVTMIIYGVITIAFFILNQDIGPLYLAFDVVPFTLAFFAFGVLFQKQLRSWNVSRWSVWVFAFLLIALYWVPTHVNIRTSTYSHGVLTWIVCLLASVMFIFVLKACESKLKNMGLSKWLNLVGQNTLLIYLVHMELLRVIPYNLLESNNVYVTTFIQTIISLVVIMLILILSRFINRYIPWSIGK